MTRKATKIVTAVAVGTLALGGVTLASAAAASAATTCDKGPWEADIAGRPAVRAGSPGGDYIWHDVRGFHLRVTHPTHDRRVYRGTITSPAPMHVVGVRLEGRDSITRSADHRSFSFTFVNHGAIDGLDFQTACASTVTVQHLRVGTRPLGAQHVYLGADKSHPAAVPFTIHRAGAA